MTENQTKAQAKTDGAVELVKKGVIYGFCNVAVLALTIYVGAFVAFPKVGAALKVAVGLGSEMAKIPNMFR